jgi:SPP1 gp7 family putative phage head morphogenesis protein
LDLIVGARVDGPKSEVATRIAQAKRQLEDPQGVAFRVAQQTSSFHRQQLGRQLKAAYGVDLFSLGGQAPIAEFVSENVALIRSMEAKYLDQVQSVLFQGLREGKRAEELSDLLEDRFSAAESHAKLIARDQVGKLYGDLNEQRQGELGIRSYTWRGAMDERERDEHVAREGQVYSWDDPPDDGHPGQPIQCRCYAEPNLSDIFE